MPTNPGDPDIVGLGITSDSDDYRHTFYGILNAQGQLWSPLPYDSEADAQRRIDSFAANERYASMKHTHKIVPVRIVLTVIEDNPS